MLGKCFDDSPHVKCMSRSGWANGMVNLERFVDGWCYTSVLLYVVALNVSQANLI